MRGVPLEPTSRMGGLPSFAASRYRREGHEETTHAEVRLGEAEGPPHELRQEHHRDPEGLLERAADLLLIALQVELAERADGDDGVDPAPDRLLQENLAQTQADIADSPGQRPPAAAGLQRPPHRLGSQR